MRTGKDVSSRRPFSTFPAQRYDTPKDCCCVFVVMGGGKNTKTDRALHLQSGKSPTITFTDVPGSFVGKIHKLLELHA